MVDQTIPGIRVDGHTPGPWITTDNIGVWIEKDRGGYRTPIAVATGYVGETERIANARLIAAAPDMFSAASKLLAVFDELQSTTMAERIITGRSDRDLRKAADEAMAELRAAIAKAVPPTLEGVDHADRS